MKYNVILKEIPRPDNFNSIMMRIKGSLNLSMTYANILIRSAPVSIFSQIEENRAKLLKQELEELGARISLVKCCEN
jgi:ribosomal protein L7/L12